jgi:hypothetical protein
LPPLEAPPALELLLPDALPNPPFAALVALVDVPPVTVPLLPVPVLTVPPFAVPPRALEPPVLTLVARPPCAGVLPMEVVPP